MTDIQIIDKVKELFDVLDKKNLTISSIESFTGGLFAAYITSVPGSSKYFLGSIISYSCQVKENVLGISPNIIKSFGTVSKETCEEMLKRGRRILKSDIVVSFTGNAGPNIDIGNKPVGLIYCGISINDINHVLEYRLDMPRNEIRKFAVYEVLNKIIKFLSNE